MTVKEAIEKRRAYRVLEKVTISDGMIETLAEAARLMPSCYNHQPWRFVFVREQAQLQNLFTALPAGNSWARQASLVIAVFGSREHDCIIGEREYYLFDLGLAAAAIILQAVELNLVAHPIAGFSPEKVKDILRIPAAAMVITLLVVGKKPHSLPGELSAEQTASENTRPARRSLQQLYSLDRYQPQLDE